MVILLFIIIYKLGDALAGAMTNTFLIEMGFSKSDIATIAKTYGFVATLVGTFIGGVMVFRFGMVKSLWICGILQMLSNLMFALQAVIGYDKTFLALTIGIENLTSGMGTAAFVGYISSLCSVSYTATQYALLSSLSSVGRTLLSTPAGYAAVQMGWVNFFIFTTFAALPGLLLMVFFSKYLRRSNAAGIGRY